METMTLEEKVIEAAKTLVAMTGRYNTELAYHNLVKALKELKEKL